MSRLQQRRQSYRRRLEAKQKAINNLRQAGRAAAVIILLWLMWQLPSTLAYFTDREETQSSFRATTFADNLSLYPGSSKTNDSPGDPGPAFNVAQIVAGQIYLDFGTYPVGNNRNFPHVLTVKNIGGRTLSLRWRFCEQLDQFFETQDEDIIIGPGAEVELGFKLDTHPADAPGEYFGTLHLSALNGFIASELPARLRLAAKKSGKGHNTTVNSGMHNSSGPSVSAVVYQGPDSCHPGQKPTDADGLPEVVESVYQDFGGQDLSGTADSPGVTVSVEQGSKDNNGTDNGNKENKSSQSGGQASEKAAGQDNSDNGDTALGEGSDN